jgi:hypothetical protein
LGKESKKGEFFLEDSAIDQWKRIDGKVADYGS